MQLTKPFKILTFNILTFFMAFRHVGFEIIYRWHSFKQIKLIIKKIVPKPIFAYFHRKQIEKLLKFPEAFSIETVNICNAKCWFCPQPDHIRTKGYMHFDVFKKIIDEISLNRKSVKSIALFMDGEPSLHKELIKFLKYAKEKKIKNIYLSSNMEFFNEKLINQLFENNLQSTLKYVIASLDGVSETTHQKNRIGVDTKKAYENTRLLLRKRRENLSIYPWVFPRMLVNETNKHEEKDFYKYWKNKSDKVLTTFMHNWGGQIDDKLIHQNTENSFSSVCYFPFSQCFIQLDGSVRICCLDVNGKEIFGNLNNSSIKEIWNNNDFAALRKNLLSGDKEKLPEICRECTYPQKGQWTLPFFWQQGF